MKYLSLVALNLFAATTAILKRNRLCKGGLMQRLPEWISMNSIIVKHVLTAKTTTKREVDARSYFPTPWHISVKSVWIDGGSKAKRGGSEDSLLSCENLCHRSIQNTFFRSPIVRVIEKTFLEWSYKKDFCRTSTKKFFANGRSWKYGEISHFFACCRMNANKCEFWKNLKTVFLQISAHFGIEWKENILLFLKYQQPMDFYVCCALVAFSS